MIFRFAWTNIKKISGNSRVGADLQKYFKSLHLQKFKPFWSHMTIFHKILMSRFFVLLWEIIIPVELWSSASLTFYMTSVINCFVLQYQWRIGYLFSSAFCSIETEKQLFELMDSRQQTQSCTVTLLIFSLCEKLM